MTFWAVVLKVLVVALVIAGLVLAGWLCYMLLKIAVFGKAVLTYLENVLYGWISSLTKGIKEFFEDLSDCFLNGGICGRISDCCPFLGEAKAIRAVGATLVFCVGVVMYYLFTGQGFDAVIVDFVDSFPLLVLSETGTVDLIKSISVLSIINMGISASVIGWIYRNCTNDYMFDGPLKLLVSFFYYLISAFAGCFTGRMLEGVWTFSANKSVELFSWIKNLAFSSGNGFSGVIKIIFGIIGLLVIVYIGVKILLVALKEYLDLICFGLTCKIIILGVAVAMEYIFGGVNTKAGEIVLAITFFLVVGVSDYIRVFIGSALEPDEGEI